jgi:hypothetical protein
MEELTLEQDGTVDWHETARFRKGMEEDVELDAEGHETFNASHVGTIQVGALLNVIEWLSHGVALFDTEAKNLEELSAELKELIVNHDLMDGDKAQKVVQTMAMHHHHVTERKKENLERQAHDDAIHRCGCDVLVGAVNFVKKPICVFIRLDEPRDLGELSTEGHYPTKFIFLCLGPDGEGHQHEKDFHEAGRAFSCLMSNKGFLDIATEAPSNGILCEAIHTFMAESDIIPHFHHMFFATQDEEQGKAEKHDDSDSDDEGVAPMTPLLLSTRHNEIWKLSRMPSPSAKPKNRSSNGSSPDRSPPLTPKSETKLGIRGNIALRASGAGHRAVMGSPPSE